MENNMSGGQAPSPAYDYRLYDQVLSLIHI